MYIILLAMLARPRIVGALTRDSTWFYPISPVMFTYIDGAMGSGFPDVRLYAVLLNTSRLMPPYID
jgi:hypothetical protein